MENTILTPTACEVRSVIRFLQAGENGAVQIHRGLYAVNGTTVMSDSSVRDWCRQFKKGCTYVQMNGAKGANRL